MKKTVKPKMVLNGEFSVPGDKSISHRAVMLGSLCEGITEIDGFLTGDDCISTISCFRKLGIKIDINGDKVRVFGNGINGLKAPKEVLYAGNSGTTVRLMSGILSAQPFDSVIDGDASIRKRPMNRIIIPLSQMGANIRGADKEGFAPLNIKGSKLTAMDYTMPIASAQVKSAIILASLYADGETVIREAAASRDHTEIMLNYFGADIKNENGVIISKPVKQLYAKPISVPGDISSAAFFISAALIVPNSEIIIKNVGVNKTRTGIIDAFLEMGANIALTNRRSVAGEDVADIHVKYSKLKATVLSGDIIPRMIDEIPVFAVAALFANGTTVIRDARELKVKESNRIAVMKEELSKMGADITETDDGMIIKGGSFLKGAETKSHMDHRVAMSISIAALMAEGETTIEDSECVSISLPNFYELLEKL